MEDLVYDSHKNKLQYIFRGNHLIYLQFIQTFFLSCPSKNKCVMCILFLLHDLHDTEKAYFSSAPYLNMDIRSKHVYIRKNRDSVHHLLDLQNVTKVTLKIHVMLARHLAETLFWPKPVFAQDDVRILPEHVMSYNGHTHTLIVVWIIHTSNILKTFEEDVFWLPVCIILA